MTSTQRCAHLEGETCRLIDRKCNRRSDRECSLFLTYNHLIKGREAEPALNARMRENVLKASLDNWRTKAMSPGYRHAASQPMESEIRRVLSEGLQDLGVQVQQRGAQYRIADGVRIFADALLQNREHTNTAIISCKVWTGSEQLRETFAYAYLARTRQAPGRQVRVFYVSLLPLDDRVKPWIEAFSNHIEGAYSICGGPYLDQLVSDIRRVYSNPA